ncbi:MAG TPA: hypothetical protein VIC83_04155 [Candidatus Limnocylindria bacterium]|jgi:hypothetical protein
MSQSVAAEQEASSEPLFLERAANRRERIREGVTMALYIALSLLAVMFALPASVTASESGSHASVLFWTSIGLLIAHQLAFRLSARLAHGKLASEHVELLAAQLIGGLAVTAIAEVPLLLIGGQAGLLVAELALITFIAVVGYVAARGVPMSRTRALLFVAGVVALTLLVIGVKNLAHY